MRRPAALLVGFGVAKLDQFDQRLPGHHRLHLREKVLPLGLLLGRGELVVREAKLVTANLPSPGSRSQDYSPVAGLGFPESP
jgi:hypothetical protein